jgi:hypothetical protein
MYFLKQWVARRTVSALRLVLQSSTLRLNAEFLLNSFLLTGKISAKINRSAQQREVSGATDRTI